MMMSLSSCPWIQDSLGILITCAGKTWLSCVAEVRDFTQIIAWKTGVDFGNIAPVRILETLSGLAGNFDRREQQVFSVGVDSIFSLA